jgi:hypothetical protein
MSTIRDTVLTLIGITITNYLVTPHLIGRMATWEEIAIALPIALVINGLIGIFFENKGENYED